MLQATILSAKCLRRDLNIRDRGGWESWNLDLGSDQLRFSPNSLRKLVQSVSERRRKDLDSTWGDGSNGYDRSFGSEPVIECARTILWWQNPACSRLQWPFLINDFLRQTKSWSPLLDPDLSSSPITNTPQWDCRSTRTSNNQPNRLWSVWLADLDTGSDWIAVENRSISSNTEQNWLHNIEQFRF